MTWELELFASLTEPPKALLVEDDEGLRTTLKHVLERAGFVVRTAGDGMAAKDLLESGTFTLVISDVKMPGKMGGLELLEYVHAAFPTMPMILMTGFGNELMSHNAIYLGARAFLPKPFAHADLMRAIRNDCGIDTDTPPIVPDLGLGLRPPGFERIEARAEIEAGVQLLATEVAELSSSPERSLSANLAEQAVFVVYAQKMLRILGLAEQMALEEIMGIARLGEELATQASLADSPALKQDCHHCLEEILTAVRGLLAPDAHSDSATGGRGALRERVQTLLKSMALDRG